MGDMDRPLGAIAYVQAFLEMLETGRRPWASRRTRSSTRRGREGRRPGCCAARNGRRPGRGSSESRVSDPKDSFTGIVRGVVEATERTLGLDAGAGPDDYIVLDDYLQDGYGIVNREVTEALRLLFRTEGIVLDPVYTVKAFIGMLDLIRKGYFRKTDKIVFFHTGGTPALFPNKLKLVEYLG